MTTYASIEAILANIEKPDQILALNPELAQKPAKEPKTEARKDLEREIREAFARQFETVWRRCGGPELIKEVELIDGRKFSNDYMCQTSKGKFIIELDGGVWTGGRHSRGGTGFINDCMKLNGAALLGYYVIRIPTGFATDIYLSQIIRDMT